MAIRFLIVDDTRFMRVMLTDILKKLDHEVVGEAENGYRAIELYQELKPDIVFMDISMPEMDGIQALSKIREIDADSIVIICSGASQQDRISEAMKMGASAYIMKPFKPKEISNIIKKYGESFVKPEPKKVVENVKIVETEIAAAAEIAEEVKEEVATVAAAVETDVQVEVAEVTDIPETIESSQEEAVEPFPTPLELGEWEENTSTEEEDDVAVTLTPFADADQMVSDVLPTINHQAKDLIEAVAEVVKEEVKEEIEQPSKIEEKRTIAEVIPILQSKNQTKNRGGETVQDFTTSYMCNWKEDNNGSDVLYQITCKEGDNRVFFDISGLTEGKQYFSIEGLRNLMKWLEANVEHSNSNLKETLNK